MEGGTALRGCWSYYINDLGYDLVMASHYQIIPEATSLQPALRVYADTYKFTK